MTRLFSKTLLTVGLSALVGSLTLSAKNVQLVADIPFAFHAEGKVMPAGQYIFSDKGFAGIFQISNPKARISRFVSAPVQKHDAPTDSKLTFARYGNEYVLTEISEAGSPYSNGVTPSAVEKNLTRKLSVSAVMAIPLRVQ